MMALLLIHQGDKTKQVGLDHLVPILLLSNKKIP